MYKLNQLVSLLLMAWLATPVQGQSTLDWPVGEFAPYQLDSGRRGNPEKHSTVVYRATVSVENAVWVRLYFDKVELEAGSFVRITSALDAEVQELDADGIAMWHNTSAYFNGDTVYLELVAGPDTTRNHVVLGRVAVQVVSEGAARGPYPCADDNCGMCGADNRVPSSENWSGRIMPVGCTGSVYNEQSCVVSAGHCADGNWDDVIQFNVPDSASSCYPYNPPVADQFPITSHIFVNGGVGNDWAVMTTGTNGSGQTAYERYGVFRPIATALGNSGDTVAVWGFGVDNDDPTRSQTQQTHSATIQTRYSTYYTHWVDITYGNSGSGLIRNNEIIGIITHCPCPGIATRVDLAAFAAAREQLCGQAGGYCFASSNSTAYEYISRVQVGSINNSSGSSGYADYTYLSTDMTIGTGYPITVTLDTTWSSDIGGLWVDWNQDEDFYDAGETITTSWSGLGPYTTTITPPAWAAAGTTRMRVRIQDGDYDPTRSPCGTTSYGEVEDYSINVVSGGCSPPDCDDGNPCTDDVCDNGTCVHTNNTAPCSDGDACTTNDACSGGACVGGPPPNCDDGNTCTNDWCNSTVGCVHSDNNNPCDDGDACTTGDACTDGACVGGPPPDCDDGNACTDDSCDPAQGCQHVDNSDPCDDGLFCTATDTCSGGVCVGAGDQCPGLLCDEIYDECVECFTPSDCDDGNFCTDDTCGGGVCSNPNNTLPCDDGLFCTQTDTCSGGGCVGSGDPCPGQLCDDVGDVCVDCFTHPECDDGNGCTEDVCIGGACYHVDNSDPCDDGDACTTDDACSGGACAGSPISCDDGNACTDDSCDPALGCRYVNNTDPCEDGDACTTGDACANGACAGGPPPDCDDGNACTDDSCDPPQGCRHVDNSDPCDDNDACTTDDTCTGGACVGAPISCDDGDTCTDDSCDPASGCEYVNNTAPCSDGDACTTGDACSGGTCAGGDPLDCDDGDTCTDDSCDPASGCEYVNNTEPCEDDVFCNGAEACSDGSCQPGADPCPGQICDERGDVCMDCVTDSGCDDGDDCTIDTCDAQMNCIHEYDVRLFADLVPPFCPPSCPQPDLDDIMCILDDFADGPTPGICADGASDLAPCGGDGSIDLDDILYMLDAFAQVHACPHPCP